MDIPVTEIGKFVRLHKQITDMTIEKGRISMNQWGYRHWYFQDLDQMLLFGQILTLLRMYTRMML